MGDGDLSTTLVTGTRVFCGCACIGVAVLDLVTGFQTGPYLIFHLVLLAGGLLLLQKSLRPVHYAAVAALAVVTTAVAALPSNQEACCMRGLDVRHGYPLTVLGWNHRRAGHFAVAHTIADLVFYFLIWMIIFYAVVLRRRRPLPQPLLAGPNSASPSTPTPVADDESVGGLP